MPAFGVAVARVTPFVHSRPAKTDTTRTATCNVLSETRVPRTPSGGLGGGAAPMPDAADAARMGIRGHYPPGIVSPASKFPGWLTSGSWGCLAAPAGYQRSSSLRGLQATHEAHSISVAQPNRKLNGRVQPVLTVCSQPTRNGPRQLKL